MRIDGPSGKRLPGAVHDLAIRLGVRTGLGPSGVTLTQTGRMKSNVRSKAWMAFTASQILSTQNCEFDWRARAGPLGLISGRDALLKGEGRFDIMALGVIPLARAAHTAALVRGELIRYLAEIAWAPQAILHNPALRWDQVREVLKQSCVRIDAAGGTYDASGRSPFYGFGRVNARKAVELALPLAGPGPLKTIKVAVDLDHTYIGDLVLKLLPPAALGAAPVVLHNQAGGSTDNIKKTYDEVNTPALTSLKGKDPSGTWTLEVADKDRADTGTLRSLRLVLTF
jgi:hypothetical protein